MGNFLPNIFHLKKLYSNAVSEVKLNLILLDDMSKVTESQFLTRALLRSQFSNKVIY